MSLTSYQTAARATKNPALIAHADAVAVASATYKAERKAIRAANNGRTDKGQLAIAKAAFMEASRIAHVAYMEASRAARAAYMGA